MKRYDCLVPGRPWHTQADDSAEIVRRATEHLRTSHDETVICPDMVERIKARIEEASAPAH